jgi:hypothetical protein
MKGYEICPILKFEKIDCDVFKNWYSHHIYEFPIPLFSFGLYSLKRF